MISPEDSFSTYEYADHYKILPAINAWCDDPKRIKEGVKVPEGFAYTSDKNSEWMSVSSLQEWIRKHRHKIGKV